ncbi:hypothetical protein [Tellurirhabdus bombi]|uniref:hypothetical protein n=1 Tax=Tellurirhabdus bombi TaxID=2907205 RepID=UPI001F411DAE|nr:hypothetical protein [Tellurirhabdus bombi]
MRFLLDELQIQAPLGSDGLKLRKDRHRLYWGFLFQKIGYVEGTGSVIFADPKATRLLRDRFGRFGVQAETRFRILEGDYTLYDGYIDYTQYSDDGERVSAALRDDKTVISLATNLTTRYSFEPTDRVKLHARRLSSPANLVLNADVATVRRSAPYNILINHSVPLKRVDEREQPLPGTMASIIRPELNTEIYQNTTDRPQSLVISGLVKVTASASHSLVPTLRVRLTEQEPIPIGSFSVSSTPELITAVVSLTVVVYPTQKLWLDWSHSDSVSSYSFAYDPDTAITVQESTTIPDSEAACFTAGELLEKLIDRASDGALSFQSNFFSSGEGSTMLLTNGGNIRGLAKPVIASFQEVFEGLNALYNLKMDIVGSHVVIEPKSFRGGPSHGVTRIPQLNNFRQIPNTDLLFSEVFTGFETWRGESLASGSEVNSQRQYRTGITTLRNTLDLRSKLIASGTLIEEQRRKQFQPDTASSSKADTLDEALFVICAIRKATGWQAERLENTDFISGVLEPASSYNLRINPRANLQRWTNLLADCLPLRLESSVGNAAARIAYNGREYSEQGIHFVVDVPLVGTTITEIEAPMSMLGYSQLTDLIEYPDPITGSWKQGLLMDASWRRSLEGNTVTFLLYT